MVDWGLAVKIACGGFGTVFIILAILCLSVRMTRSVAEMMAEEEPEKYYTKDSSPEINLLSSRKE